VDLYLKVRLARRGGMSERAAAGHFGISRASVNKMMSFSVPPGYQRTAPIKRSKLDGCGFRKVPDSDYGKSRTRISVSPGQGFR
jgi:hypothetical protein